MNRVPVKSMLTPLTVLATLVLVVNVAVFAAWTAPRWSARLGVAAGSGGVENARQRIEPALEFARDTYGRLGRADEELEAFRGRLVTTVGGAELLGLLTEAGKTAGIELADATLQYAPIDELGVVQLAIGFPVTGSYESMRRLLHELSALPVFLVIDGVGLQAFGSSANVPAGVGAGQPIRVDLALSVFIEDPAFAPATAPAAAARPVVDTRHIAGLHAANESGDPDRIADAVLANLAALPSLPVAADALVIDLDALDAPVATSEPRRNLFSIVLPPAPEPDPQDFEDVYVEPEPILPVRLLGILLVDGQRRASLTDEQRVFVVQGGDMLPNGVRIDEIGPDYVRLTFNDQTTVLSLEGIRP